ncbi:MAG TPA: hypothetical protein VFV89_00665 [Nocardioides sp.]|uniref:hypothetical protein n=1 Tax=Nocardioides sp. TaxID=35761 RepID=UPI002E344DCD|nr:hypothetical protein [Nocardioides sp.]HEX5086290.1 hypothetical protein [Nocardioides sp.]
MGCILTFFTFLFPRAAFFVIWMARPSLVNDAFDTFLIPFFGLFIFPYTCLVYVVLHEQGGVSGAEWIWIAVAVVLDVGNMAGGFVQRGEYASRYPPPWVKG